MLGSIKRELKNVRKGTGLGFIQGLSLFYLTKPSKIGTDLVLRNRQIGTDLVFTEIWKAGTDLE